MRYSLIHPERRRPRSGMRPAMTMTGEELGKLLAESDAPPTVPRPQLSAWCAKHMMDIEDDF